MAARGFMNKQQRAAELIQALYRGFRERRRTGKLRNARARANRDRKRHEAEETALQAEIDRRLAEERRKRALSKPPPPQEDLPPPRRAMPAPRRAPVAEQEEGTLVYNAECTLPVQKAGAGGAGGESPTTRSSRSGQQRLSSSYGGSLPAQQSSVVAQVTASVVAWIDPPAVRVRVKS